MRKWKIGSLFLLYSKKLWKEIMIFLLFCSIFAIVFYLYRLPVEAVLYAASICGFIGILFLLFGFLQYYKKHSRLTNLKNSILVGIGELPQPKDRIEQDYQELLQLLLSEKNKQETKAKLEHRELIDYYTLWVHQIKTPIAAMRLLLQAGESETNKELQVELFKIEQYVEMVLGYLRLGSMSSDLVLKKYDLDSIIKQAVRKYAKLFIGKKISLDYEDLNCEVLTDQKWLVFVIEQLLSNALKYTKQGTIRIYMEKDQEKTLTIEDTGIGIRQEDLPRVFEKGFTGYNGRVEKRSTGIGLYLCKQIITKLSHDIRITSEPEKGTKIMLDLEARKITIE